MFFAYKYGDQGQLLDRDKMVRKHYATRVWRITGEAMDRISYAIGNATPHALFDFACMLSAPCDDRDWDLEETDSESSGSDVASLWEDDALDGPLDDGDATWDPTMPEADTDIEMTDAPDLSASAGSNYMSDNYFQGGNNGQADMSTLDQALSSTPPGSAAPVQNLDDSDIPRAFGHLQVQDSRSPEDTAEQALPSDLFQENENKGTFEHIEDVNDSGRKSPAVSEEDQCVTEHVEDVGDAETENADVDDGDCTDDEDTDDESNTDPIQRRRTVLENDVADVEVYWKTFQRLPAKHPAQHEITGKYIYWAHLGAQAAGDFLNGFVYYSNKTEPAMPGKPLMRLRPIKSKRRRHPPKY
ncbi:hypothetical protein CkaCkLH20_12645 [Colletotrichum karsti]|uniref:Uncharacterized protein n=1 Tax=Colletotrichum karsti TaxID=1095194 RepID=A0A9P6HVW6_9PEZI|nr:uncharacterized protein CkaCkLH20_12645 [Colletotrichum karsti]KAF9869846.1 hypothetical protein CkaCkLH20_12645 [Colletotrichum karsti]